MARRTLLLAGTVLVLASCSFSASTSDTFPAFTAPVVDAAGALSADVEASLSGELEAFRDAGGPQVAVAVVDTTGNATIEDYTIDLAREWGVGDAARDDGVVILVALSDRELRIEVGSGVEGDLTDVAASRIVQDVMVPRLRVDDVEGAVVEGARAVMATWSGVVYVDPGTGPDTGTTSQVEWWSVAVFLLFVMMVIVFPLVGMVLGRRGRIFGGGVFIPGGFSGGGFGGFGGGGGGFSGGGGGGFSGGGSSGSW